MTSKLAITDRMILCHGLIHLEQTLTLMRWCKIESFEMIKIENQLKRLKAELLGYSDLDQMYADLSVEYSQIK
jgi:hypothetical protein